MQPPPFEPNYQPMAPRRSNTLLWVILGGVLGCCLLLIVGGGATGYWAFNKARPMAECTIETSALAKAFDSYSKAHGGKLPPAISWQSDIGKAYDSYLKTNGTDKSGPLKISHANEPFTCGSGADATGLIYNSDVAGKKLSAIKDPANTFVIFESRTIGVNAAAPYTPLPAEQRPKLFNEPRPGFAVTADLEPKVLGKHGRARSISGGNGSFKIDTND